MNKRIILLSLFVTCIALSLSAQQKRLGVYAAAFYNLENLWDTEDDPDNPGDDEFTPKGPYEWTETKYRQKLNNVAKVISQLALDYCPAGPAIIGISEVENRKVVEDLVKAEPVASRNYQIVHFESPDHRGIDVAALYNPRLFRFISAQKYPFNKPDMPDYRTRDILLVNGLLAGEPFHLIVNHWPSRYGGAKSSPLREFAASIVKHIADSLHADNPEAKVLIVGDLNDDPSDPSCSKVLGAKKNKKDVKPDGYFNATWKFFDEGIGSLCYQDKWNLFDQQIVSGNLLGKDRSTLKFWKSEIFNRSFLIQQEGKYKGYPLRTFSGTTFQNGYSDHLPTLTYFIKEIQ
ncbi:MULTISPECIES: endonuclease/exonuclease/phosphatase family protein [Bacteroides]|uniref:Endonuclease/exonuclease/phosphatase family protein n=1 Tax=Bacteroides gallinaceum TaxID=1462571 RepID=A0ABT7VG81_9BACE|nr:MULTISPECIES: endonuclease/exonuclease/phosphatase family protein [Bacteroides]MBW9200113.1 endonuclease/exonuclease/phosphatase family protein [Bacteroidales bacterium SW299]MCR8917906.1 endonuclease/exonuclease/phosphatase family protein [Bacteroides sp. ET225]MDM8207661.1 endonuclease/exonuclease/phosphatase family protein [Bacteroides gallinaceum]MDM8325299.1 endonuclease/exonuclease/phosphatase family protein [Bacteroides gallinaceum]